MRRISFLFLSFYACSVIAQDVKLNEQKLTTSLKQHIVTLASDKMEGREAGTKGELLAADYIIKQFKAIGLQPKGTTEFLQKFPFTAGVKYGKNNQLNINGKSFKFQDDFFPLPFSATKKITAKIIKVKFGIVAPTLNYDDYSGLADVKGKIFLIELSSPDGVHPHSKYKDVSGIKQKIDNAIAKGAAGIIFINSDTTLQNPSFSKPENSKESPVAIPVIFATAQAYKELFNDAEKSVTMETEINKDERTAENIIGYIDNNAATTIIIGAHYDHLGWGAEHSTSINNKPAIHNGADDNASGVAGMIELARYYKNSDKKKNNYLFIAFTGEEKGLFGSSYYTKNPTLDFTKVNYMINMDMIGRLNNDEKTIHIYGTGTSPEWNKILTTLSIDSIKIKSIESGTGPSDHTSFYLKDIPVLYFFSGFHTNYHKPSDDEDKINYKGEISILKYIITIINQLDDKGKIVFTKTKDTPMSSSGSGKPRVTLGVIPDYMSDGKGVRAEGISEGKPAAVVGIKKGDVITQIGEYPITDMGSYMKALTNFKKGDKTVVKVKRENTVMDFSVEF